MPATQNVLAAPRISAEQNPAALFETLNAFQHSMALKGAIELDLFTHVASGADTSAELADRCHASERGLRILCDFLTVIGFLKKNGQQYSLTPETGPFLDRRSPQYMGSAAHFLTHPGRVAQFSDVAALVRKGGTIDGDLGANSEAWVDFARYMVPIVMPAALAAADVLSSPGQSHKVLDVAAGHGMFGISIARRSRAAEIFPLDSQAVLQVALENAAKAGVEERVHPIAGNAFDVDLGSDYDLVLLPNFLHHFDVPTNVALLKRLRAAMKPGATLATIDFVPNDDRVSPPIPASFSLIMLAGTEAGDTYTFVEFDRMFRQAGFGESRIQPLEPTPLSLIVTAR